MFVTLRALYFKELKAYFQSLLAYIFIVVFLVALNWLYWQNVFLIGQTSMRDWFSLLPWFFLFLLPALTMRLWSEERKLGTVELVLTLPVSDWQVVLAKAKATVTFVIIVLAISLVTPLTLSRLGTLDWGPVWGAYLGAVLLSLLYVCLGQFISACTKNQIVAYLVTVVVGFILLLIGLPQMTAGHGVLAAVLNSLSSLTHFQNLAKGVITVRDVMYYLSFSAVWLYATVAVLQKRHYQ